MNLRNIIISAIVLVFSACTQTTSENVKEAAKVKPKNIIFLIGDGMGLAQVHAGMTANKGHLNLERTKYIGLSKTSSASNYITDSAAGGTAFSTGKKTYNGAIGVDTDTIPLKNICEILAEKGYKTGVVSTSGITHATPASFYAHEKSRNDYENIAADFLESPLDLLIGGGKDNFNKREDGMDLLAELEAKSFGVFEGMDGIDYSKYEKMAVFTAEGHNPSILDGRGDMLLDATSLAIDFLNKSGDGFFVMIEGSQIDWGGHANSKDYVVTEMVDFDKAVGLALDFAKEDGETLVVVTADHETGGMSVLNGDFEEGTVETSFTTGGHTAIMVPVFAYGPGAEEFAGIYENTALFDKFLSFTE